MHTRLSLRAFIVTISLVALAMVQPVGAADPTAVAISRLEFGGSIGKLLWVSVDNLQDAPTLEESDQYLKLANKLKEQIEQGRASSSLVKNNFNVVATSLIYAASVDPEPLSKSAAGIAAWGAKKAGDAIAGMVADESQKQMKAILAQGLKTSGLSQSELRNMTPRELSNRVGDFKIGGKKLRDALKDQPESLSLLQANAIDVATDIGVEALSRATGAAVDAKAIQKDLAATNAKIVAYQHEVGEHLSRIESQVTGLEMATRTATQKLDELKRQVQGNTEAIHVVAQVSYSGWTTSQKLQAVEGGLFPQLTATQREALIESLKADQTRERLISGIQQAAQDFGNLATIASNIGLPPNTVKAMQGAQILATGITKFAAGDGLGSIASITSLVGLGSPDAAAQRHAAMMQYLAQQFAIVNQKLDTIIDLQVRTLKELEALAKEQQTFRREVLGQLDRIEDTVLRSERVLQAVLLSKWTECYSLINGTALNGQFSIPNRTILAEILANQNVPSYAGHCYSTMTSFLDAWVKPAQWSGQIISAANFPADAIANDSVLQLSWTAFQRQRVASYSSAATFLLNALPEASGMPAKYLAHISQPVADVYYAKRLDDLFSRPSFAGQFEQFGCDRQEVLSPGLRDLICFGIVDGSSSPPLVTRWRELLSAALIGPHSIRLIDTGITLAAISDFARRTGEESFVLVRPEVIENFSQNGPTKELNDALAEHKGVALLSKLQWLTEAMVLQQGVTYGSFTAELVERELYDPATKSFRLDSQKLTPTQRLALEAMKLNPVLARNVVMLGMRHALEDSMGGVSKAEAARYRQTYYHLALQDFGGPQACTAAYPLSRAKLAELFPSWSFEYRVTAAQKASDPSLKDCPEESRSNLDSTNPLPEFGAGVAVSLGNFYAIAPSPLTLSDGIFEQSDSLRLALEYRDRISQELIDRNIAQVVKDLKGVGLPEISAARIAFMLLNEGWGWQGRRKLK